MKARSRELLARAVAAMVAAIDVYNKLDFAYREETFAILAINAWELLLKAKWLADHGNRLQSLFVNEAKSGSKRPRYKKTRSGARMTHSVGYLAKKLAEADKLDKRALRNLEAMLELRDTAIHFYHHNPAISERVLELGLACVKNFVSAAKEWFDEDLSRFHTYLMPLSINPLSSVTSVQLTRDERSFVEYLERLRPQEEDPASPYTFALNVEVRFVRSKASEAFPVRITQNSDAPVVRLTEEQIREQYPWDYRELTQRCKGRYKNFKVDQKYHSIRKSLEFNKRFAHERRLDPEKPKPRKMFYATAILEELDKHYIKKDR